MNTVLVELRLIVNMRNNLKLESYFKLKSAMFLKYKLAYLVDPIFVLENLYSAVKCANCVCI